VTFRDLLRALEQQRPLSSVDGLWYRDGRDVQADDTTPGDTRRRRRHRAPKRGARVLSGYTMLGRAVDVVETSRGCTFDCSFCSIIEMRGRNFHRFPIPARDCRHR